MQKYTQLLQYYTTIHGRRGGGAVPIQFVEGDTLVTKPVEVATLYNDYCVKITRGIGQPTADTSHMSDAEFVAYSVMKYHDHSSIKRIRDCMGKSEVPTTFNFKEVSIDGVQKILNKVNKKKLQGITRYFHAVSEMELDTWQGLWPICLMKLYINLASQLNTKLQT